MHFIIILLILHYSNALTGRHYRSQSVHIQDRNLTDDQSHEVMSCISLDVGLVSCAVKFMEEVSLALT